MIQQFLVGSIINPCIGHRQKTRRIFAEIVLEAFLGPYIHMPDDHLIGSTNECGQRVFRDARGEELAFFVETYIHGHNGSSLLLSWGRPVCWRSPLIREKPGDKIDDRLSVYAV